MNPPPNTHPCAECGAPIASPHALCCSDRCRTQRKRAGRATPRAEYLAQLCGSRLPAYHDRAPRPLPSGTTLRALVTSLAQRVEALERAQTDPTQTPHLEPPGD